MSLQVHVRNLSVGQRRLVHDLRLDVAPGTVHTLMGESGCGKSSLLAAICGTAAAPVRFEGEVVLDGTRLDTVPTRRRGIAILCGPKTERVAQIVDELALALEDAAEGFLAGHFREVDAESTCGNDHDRRVDDLASSVLERQRRSAELHVAHARFAGQVRPRRRQ